MTYCSIECILKILIKSLKFINTMFYSTTPINIYYVCYFIPVYARQVKLLLIRLKTTVSLDL